MARLRERTSKPTKATKALDELLFTGDPKQDGLTVGALGLMGTWEVARYLGVEKSRIARWLDELDRGKEPIAAPVARLKSGSFWRIEDVQAKLAAMYAEARSPYGKTAAGRERWAAERRDTRARREQGVIAA